MGTYYLVGCLLILTILVQGEKTTSEKHNDTDKRQFIAYPGAYEANQLNDRQVAPCCPPEMYCPDRPPCSPALADAPAPYVDANQDVQAGYQGQAVAFPPPPTTLPQAQEKSDDLPPNRDEVYDVEGQNFKSVGCWRDTWDRAIPLLERKHPLLQEPDYKARSNALIKCAKAAKDLKLKMFAVQNGGQCFGGKDADRTFMKYGVSKTCRGDGEGGPWGNEVYSFLSKGPENDAALSKAMPNATEQNDVIEPTTTPLADLRQPPKPSMAVPVDLATNSKAAAEPPVVLTDPGTDVDESKSSDKLPMSDDEVNPLSPTLLPTKATEEDFAIVNEDRENDSQEDKAESNVQDHEKATPTHATPTVVTPTAAVPTEAVNPTKASDENVNTLETPNEDDNEEGDHLVAKPTLTKPTAAVKITNPPESHDMETIPTESAPSSTLDSIQLDQPVEDSTVGKQKVLSNKVPNIDQVDELQDNFLDIKKGKDQLEEPLESDMKDKQSTTDKEAQQSFPGLEMLPIPHENAGGRNNVPKAKINKTVSVPKSEKAKVVTASNSKRHDMGLWETKDDSFPLDPTESKNMTLDLKALNEKPAQAVQQSNAAPVLGTDLGKSNGHHDSLSSAIAQAEKEADSKAGHQITLHGTKTERLSSFDNSSPSDSLQETSSPQEQPSEHNDDAPSSFTGKFDTSPIRPPIIRPRVCPPCRKFFHSMV